MKFALPFALVALLLGGGKKNTTSASAQTRLQPQEVQWYQTGAPAQPAIAVGELAVNPPAVHSGQQATVTVKLANVKAGTDITLAWFGPNGWNISDQHAIATGNTMTFQAPVESFGTPGKYTAELRNDVQLLGVTSLVVQ